MRRRLVCVVLIGLVGSGGIAAQSPERLAHRRQRSGRHEVLAAHADHAGERHPARDGVDLRHGRAGRGLHHHADRHQQRDVLPGPGHDHRRAAGRHRQGALEVRPQESQGPRRQPVGRRPRHLLLGRHGARRAAHRHRRRRTGSSSSSTRRPAKPIPGPAGVDQSRHRRHGEVRRRLLDQHAAGALQEPGDHRRRAPASRDATGFPAIRARSIC